VKPMAGGGDPSETVVFATARPHSELARENLAARNPCRQQIDSRSNDDEASRCGDDHGFGVDRRYRAMLSAPSLALFHHQGALGFLMQVVEEHVTAGLLGFDLDQTFGVGLDHGLNLQRLALELDR